MSSRIRQGAILAAGEGSRLREDGWSMAKPLVPVAGVPLIEHVVANFAAAGIRRLAIIFNESERECVSHMGHVRERFPDLELRILLKNTASSLESFREVSALLEPGPALFSTVDAWCPRNDFLDFFGAAEPHASETVLAVTPFVQDERPLWVRTEETGRVIAIGGSSGEAVTAGLYVFSERSRKLPIDPALPRLRDFLAWLLERGETVRAVSIPKVIDVDRSSDVEAAERLAAESVRPPVPPSPRLPVAPSPHPRVPTWGIYRELAHSPGRETDDAEILHTVGRRLEERGFSVAFKTAEEISDGSAEPPSFLFVMCERPEILGLLARWENRGALSINRASAVLNTYRERMVPLLESARAPLPASRVVPTSSQTQTETVLSELGAERECWVKRGDVHNTQAGDVVFAAGAAQVQIAMHEMERRGISRAVLQRHVAGDLVKFYGIGGAGEESPGSPRPPVSVSPRPSFRSGDAGTRRRGELAAEQENWFHWFYHRDQRLENYAFDAQELRRIATRAAACLGLEIYGGDAIVTPQGDIFVIDVNAWPSFALYREIAASRIAAYLDARLRKEARIEVSE